MKITAKSELYRDIKNLFDSFSPYYAHKNINSFYSPRVNYLCSQVEAVRVNQKNIQAGTQVSFGQDSQYITHNAGYERNEEIRLHWYSKTKGFPTDYFQASAQVIELWSPELDMAISKDMDSLDFKLTIPPHTPANTLEQTLISWQAMLSHSVFVHMELAKCLNTNLVKKTPEILSQIMESHLPIHFYEDLAYLSACPEVFEFFLQNNYLSLPENTGEWFRTIENRIFSQFKGTVLEIQADFHDQQDNILDIIYHYQDKKQFHETLTQKLNQPVCKTNKPKVKI